MFNNMMLAQLMKDLQVCFHALLCWDFGGTGTSR